MQSILKEQIVETNSPILSKTHLVEREILAEGSPIKQRYYRVSPNVQKHIDAEVDKMLESDVIEKSNSSWSSPILLVPKKDGTYRFVVDIRKLNKITKKDAYPLPYISDILDRLKNSVYLSSIDIKTAYWQIPLLEKSKEMTAFTIPGRGLFHFNRLAFGLCNAPATFQRFIDRVLGPALEPHVFVYLDDIIISTETFEKHCEVLNEVLRRLKEAGLSLNKEKCQVGLPELKYLGYVVNKHGLHVDPDKVSVILNTSLYQQMLLK